MNIKKSIIALFLAIVCLIPMGVSAKAIYNIIDNQQLMETGKLFSNAILLEGDASETEVNWDLCTNPKALKVFKFIGNILKVAFIAIPIILIIMGSIDFLKAIAANKDDDIKKAQMAFVKRIIAAIIVFLVPFIVSLIMDLLPSNDEVKNSNCLTCVLDPDSCVTQ